MSSKRIKQVAEQNVQRLRSDMRERLRVMGTTLSADERRLALTSETPAAKQLRGLANMLDIDFEAELGKPPYGTWRDD